MDDADYESKKKSLSECDCLAGNLKSQSALKMLERVSADSAVQTAEWAYSVLADEYTE